MIKLTHLVEDIKWQDRAINFTKRGYIPITPKIGGILYDNVTTKTFHISGIRQIDDMKKLVGKKKSLSTFTKMAKWYLEGMEGIQTNGGVLYELQGTLLLKSYMDVMSRPDEQGRRWVSPFEFNTAYNRDFSNTITKFTDKLEKLYKTYRSKFEKNPDNKMTAEFLKAYIDICEEWVVKNKKKIIEHLTQINPSLADSASWDEILVNNIQIYDVLVKYDPKLKNVGHSPEEAEEIRKKLEKISKGKVYIEKDPDPIKFVDDRKYIMK